MKGICLGWEYNDFGEFFVADDENSTKPNNFMIPTVQETKHKIYLLEQTMFPRTKMVLKLKFDFYKK